MSVSVRKDCLALYNGKLLRYACAQKEFREITRQDMVESNAVDLTIDLFDLRAQVDSIEYTLKNKFIIYMYDKGIEVQYTDIRISGCSAKAVIFRRVLSKNEDGTEDCEYVSVSVEDLAKITDIP